MITKSQFVDKAADLVEDYFPKGQTKMRGNAMVLVAMITSYLIDEGVIEDEK